MNIKFTETQKFRQPWLWGTLILGDFAAFLGVLICMWRANGSYTGYEWLVYLCLVIIVSLPLLLFALTKMQIEVNESEIVINFFPFHLFSGPKKISLSEIRAAEVRQYRPIGEYGGWGLRGFGANRAYNVSGNMGVQIELNDGQRIMIGSQRSKELEDAIGHAS